MSNKSNRNKNTARNTARNRRRRARRRAMAAGLNGAYEDPGLLTLFNPRVGPKKWPDGSGIPTIAYREVTRFILTTDSAGRAALYIKPGVMRELYTDSFTFSGSVVTNVTWAGSGNYATLNNSITRYRVNAAYVKAAYIHNTLENQGRIATKLYMANTTADGTPSTVDGMPSNYGASSIQQTFSPLRDGVTMVVPPTDLGRRVFRTVSSDDAQDNFHFPGVALFVAGGAASTDILELEVVQDLELIPDAGNYISRAASEAPPDNPLQRERVSRQYTALRGAAAEVQPTSTFNGEGGFLDAVTKVLDSPHAQRFYKSGMSLFGRSAHEALGQGYEMDHDMQQWQLTN